MILGCSAAYYSPPSSGGAVGAERELHDQPAGLRTHTLLTIGACLFTLISAFGFGGPADPSRLAAQIVTGIGFLGGGAIVRHGLTVKGLTTAASIWATSSIEVAVGSSRLLPDTRTPFVPGPRPPGHGRLGAFVDVRVEVRPAISTEGLRENTSVKQLHALPDR